MSDAILYDVKDNIAIISLNNPPVNALGHAVRIGVDEKLKKALADDVVQAIVVTGAGRFFSGGADITEFGKPISDPWLPDVLTNLEQSPKLVIAAINGMALGGGLETALACHYRIASSKAKLGLPEVHLGLLPGAGGTQRLPRLAGAKVALDMIVSGKPAAAQQALDAGFIDAVDDSEDFLSAAVNYAKQLVTENQSVRTCHELSVDTSAIDNDFFDQYRQGIARKTKGFFAPEKCIQAIEAACALPLKEGLEKENALFMECMDTPQARAQQHLFFAERAVNSIPGVNKETPIKQIKSVAIIGSGTMGGGIAMNFANVGISAKIVDLNQEAIDKGLSIIQKNYDVSVKRGRFSEEQVQERMDLLTGTMDYADLADVDLVIEAVFENMEIKKKVFQQLDAVCKPDCILATNTSTLDVNEIAAVTSRPEQVVGLHFFSPANVMKLLEVVNAEKTDKGVLASVLAMAKAIKKIPVVAGVCFGFIGNRMLEPYAREGHQLLLEGATPEQVDGVCTDLVGMNMGPLSMYDLAGVDIGRLIRDSRRDEISHDPAYYLVADKLVDMGRLGQKTGAGMYRYEGRDRINDPEVEALIEKTAEELGIERREISDQEIFERMFYSLINEGAMILEENIAYRSGDIDIVWCNGYGFPAYRGGPMQYADEIGLDKVYKGMCKYRDTLGQHGQWWFQPSKLLEDYATSGKNFADFV